METTINASFWETGSVRLYLQTLTRLISSPSAFFRALPDGPVHRGAFRFLLLSSLFFVAVSLTYFFDKAVIMVVILMANSLLMPIITAGISFMLLTMFSGRTVSFSRMFSLYAYATGTVMMVSWIPGLIWITELWRLVLVVIGLNRGCGLSWARSVILVVLTMTVIAPGVAEASIVRPIQPISGPAL